MRLTQQQLEAHLWGAANILRGKTAGQDYKNYILSLMFYKRLCDQWENEADEAIAELERQQGRQFSDAQKAVFRARGEHRFSIPDGSRWGDVLAASVNLGEKLTQAMRAVAAANEELKGVFTVDWNQPAPDGSGKPLIPNEVVHALIQHFDSHDLSNASVPPDVLGHAYEYLIKQFADDAGAKAGEFFTPPEVVDTLVRILEPQPGDTIYDPTCGSGGMLVHSANFLRENEHHATSAQYFGQEMNWGNAAIGKINSVLHGLEASISAGVSTITDPTFKDGEGKVRKFSLVLANFPFSDEFWWLKPEQQTDDKKKKDKLKKEIFGKEGYKDPFGRFGRGTAFKAPPAGYGDYAFILHILASLTDAGRAGIVCPQGVLFRGQPEVEEETGEFDDDGNPTGDFQDPEAPEGQQLPVTPEFKGNITARYEFPLMGYDSYTRGSLVYVGERESSLLTYDREVLGQVPAYTSVDLAAGFGKQGWNAELYISNVFDETRETGRGVSCVTEVCGEQVYSFILPPRTIGIRFSQEF